MRRTLWVIRHWIIGFRSERPGNFPGFSHAPLDCWCLAPWNQPGVWPVGLKFWPRSAVGPSDVSHCPATRQWGTVTGILATLCLTALMLACPATGYAQSPPSAPGSDAPEGAVATPLTGPGSPPGSVQMPANLMPPPVNTWESKWNVDERGKFGGLMRTYMCLSADPPPECLRRKGDDQNDAASLEDIEAVKRDALDIAAWNKLREAWPNIAFNDDDVGVIMRRAENKQDPEAFEMIGYMEQNGQGLAQDSIAAFKSYRKAYEGGRKSAGPALAEVFRTMAPPQKAELNAWLKAQGGDAAVVKDRKLGPPSPMRPAT